MRRPDQSPPHKIPPPPPSSLRPPRFPAPAAAPEMRRSLTKQRSLPAAPPARAAPPLAKQRSLPTAEDMLAEAWRRRGELHRSDRLGIRRSVTDDDFDEIRGCLELGFSFDGIDFEKEESRKITGLLPALELIYGRAACDSPSASSSSSSLSDASPVHSPVSITSPGDSVETVKARLIQWARVVALSMSQRI